MTKAEKHKAYMRLYRAKRRADGMCLYCISTPKPNRTLCEVHLLRHALSQVRTRARQRATTRPRGQEIA